MKPVVRIVASAMASVVVWATWPSTAYAQVTTDFESGYCVHDADGDGFMDVDEMTPTTSAGAVTIFSSDFESETLYSITVQSISGGAVSRTVTNLTGTPNTISNGGDSHQPFNGLAFDADTGDGLRLSSGNNYSFNIDGRCSTGETRTDTNTVPDPEETDTHTSERTFQTINGSNRGNTGGVSADISSVDISGFEIEGNIVLDMTADVGGNIVFNEADPGGGGQAGDITMTIGTGSEIFGDVVFGDRSALNTNAAHDVVFTNAGTGFDLDLQSTDNVTVTNTGSIGAVGGYGIDATGVTTGLSITNNNGGNITNIDASDTNILTITNNSGASIDGILLNDAANPVTGDVSTTVTNAGTLGLLTADRVGQFAFTNSGTITSPTDAAIVLSNSASLNFTNSGTVTAGSSDTIDLTDYTGSMTMTNTGTVSASTNNAINGDGSSGTYTFNNNGTISNSANNGVTLQNVSGAIIFNNASAAAGTVSTNQVALDFSDTGASDSMDVTVTNGAQGTISANFGTAIEADGVSDFAVTNLGTISAGVSDTIVANGAGNITLSNSATGASITAGSLTAFDGNGATGTVTISNVGTISAFNQTIDLQDVDGEVSVTNSGTIRATHGLADARTNLAENYTIDISRDSTATGNDVTFDNQSGGTISTNSDRAVGIREFGLAGDTVTITNAGTISAGRDLALDLENSDEVMLTNASGATISAANDNAIDLTNSQSATISNAGTISAGRDNAINLTAASGVTLTNSGTISAGRDYALLLTNVTGASMVISNSGTISAGSDSVGSAPAAIFGTLAAGVDVIDITNAASASITSVGDATANGGAIFLNAASAVVNITNAGTIQAGRLASTGVTAVEGNNAIRITNIQSNDVSLTNNTGGTILATGDVAVHFAATTGNISAFTLTNAASAVIEADNDVIELVNVTGASATITNAGTIRATDSAADHVLNLDGFSSDITLTNSGTISSAGDRAVQGALHTTGTASMTMSNSGTISADNETVFITFNTAAPLIFSNAAGGTISASEDDAVVFTNVASAVSFSTGAGSTITADDDTVVFASVANTAVLDFDNAGTISATDSSANHVLDFDGFGGTLDINNASGGVISSSGSNALTADHSSGTAGSRALSFTNAGTIRSATGNAVNMTGFDDTVTFTNSGTIEVTGGNNALQVSGGDHIVFTNSGRIEASGTGAVAFTNITDDGDSDTIPTFTNDTNGVLRASANVLTIAGANTQRYAIVNRGTITADTGQYAIDATGLNVNLTTSGSVTAVGQTAIRVGEDSNLTISGTVSAGGSNPRAVELEGRGSEIELIDGAVVVGTFYPLDQALDYSDAEKHKVKLTAVSNASYLYNFDDRYFTFAINDETQSGASGFSPATSNFEAMTLMHDHHGQHTRNIWREFSRFKGQAGLRSFYFSDSLDNKRMTTRNFKLDGDRSGFAQSLQQSVFGLFDAEVILISSDSSYALDDDIFTFDQTYQAAGFGFTDLLSLGPFSISAMALTGIGETDVKRKVFTNTNASGSFILSSSYDSTLLDIVYEALLDVTVYGNTRRLTRRKPYRVNVELGLGGSLHTENADGYSEQTYMTTSGSDFESNAVGGRLKVELEARNPFTRRLWTAFMEFESMTSEITGGNDFSFTASGMADTYTADVEALAVNTLSFGANYQVEQDIDVNFSYATTSRDNDSDETSAKLAVKWVF